MVAKESKAKTVDVPKKDKTPKKEKAPKTKKEEEEEDVPETEPVTKQDKKEQKKEKKDKKKSKKDKKSKKEEKEEEEKESEEEKETKKDKKKKDKKAKKEEKDEEMTESKEEEEEADNKRKREDDDEESAQDEQPAKAAKSDDEVKPVVYVSRLSYQIQEETLKEFFSDCGELVNIEWINDSSNKFCGGAVLTFADMDSVEKALAKNGQEVDGRNAAVDGVKEIPADCTTLFVGGLPKTLVEEDFKQVLADNNISFSSIRFPTDKFTQEYKGIAFIDFETTEQVKAAYHSNLRNVGYMGRCLNYDPSAPRQGGGGGGDRPQGGRGGFGGGRGGRGGFGDRGGRGGRGGFGGGRGGRGGFGDRGGRGGRGGFGGRGGGGRGGFGGRKTTFDE